MHGAASGLIEAFQTYYAGTGSGVANAASWAEIPAPPAGFFKYGSGGISALATLCGIPNGCCAVLGLVGKGGAGNVMDHYATTLYPHADLEGYSGYDGNTWSGMVTPPDPIDDADVLAHTISYSPICHASISKWCYAAGVNLAMKDAQSRNYKNDRCGKVCADMAAFTARVINGQVTYPDTNPPYYSLGASDYTLPAVTQECIGCHHKKADAPDIPAQLTEMQCDTCHGDHLGEFHAGSALTIQDAWVSKVNNAIKSGYYPGQNVRYHVIFHVNNRGSTFVRSINSKAKGPTSTGTWKDKLPTKKETYGSGQNIELKWDRTIDANAVVGSKGTLVVRLLAMDYPGGTVQAQDERIVKFNIVAAY